MGAQLSAVVPSCGDCLAQARPGRFARDCCRRHLCVRRGPSTGHTTERAREDRRTLRTRSRQRGMAERCRTADHRPLPPDDHRRRPARREDRPAAGEDRRRPDNGPAAALPAIPNACHEQQDRACRRAHGARRRGPQPRSDVPPRRRRAHVVRQAPPDPGHRAVYAGRPTRDVRHLGTDDLQGPGLPGAGSAVRRARHLAPARPRARLHQRRLAAQPDGAAARYRERHPDRPRRQPGPPHPDRRERPYRRRNHRPRQRTGRPDRRTPTGSRSHALHRLG